MSHLLSNSLHRPSTRRPGAAALSAGLCALLTPALAFAQEAAAAAPAAPAAAGPGRTALVLFWIIAAGTVGGAIGTVTARNTVTAVMSLVGCFFGVAALYALLNAHFLAAIQVLVYAGAIMTLFVFVVMVLNREEVERFSLRAVFTKGIGVIAAAWLVLRTSVYLVGDLTVVVKPEAPEPGWGGVADIGMQLFARHLFSFEAVSLPLLVAVIGAVVVARTPKRTLHEHEGGLSHRPVDAEGNPVPFDDTEAEDEGHDDHAAAAGHDAHGHH